MARFSDTDQQHVFSQTAISVSSPENEGGLRLGSQIA